MDLLIFITYTELQYTFCDILFLVCVCVCVDGDTLPLKTRLHEIKTKLFVLYVYFVQFPITMLPQTNLSIFKRNFFEIL